jgi:hypothetical protein
VAVDLDGLPAFSFSFALFSFDFSAVLNSG